jgi:hypothetical protein
MKPQLTNRLKECIFNLNKKKQMKKIKSNILSIKSNRQVLTAAIKNLSDMDLVILRERILAVTEQVINNKVELMETMQNNIIHPSLYVGACERIFYAVDFRD